MADQDKECTIEGCTRMQWARGWCGTHYRRWRTHGDPNKVEFAVTRTPEEAFELRTTPGENGCIEWTGSRQRGYGQMRYQGKTCLAHRVAWELVNGPIPDGLFLNHKCWNPSCVNVEHLEVVNNSENMAYRPGPQKNNTSGVRNVWFRKSTGKWYTDVTWNGVKHRTGPWDSIEDAAEDAARLRSEVFGSFAGRG